LGIATFATGINDAGQIVGFYNENNFIRHGFVHNPDDGTFTTLDDPLATGDTLASGINNMGQIVGYYVNASGTHGFLYSNGTYTTLDDPLGTTTEALGINDAGQIVGFYKDSGLEEHGFLLTITPNPAAPAGTTADMILRGSNTSSAVAGQYEIYDLGNNAMLSGNSLGQIGTDWAFVTLGGFNAGDTSDLLLRNVNTGGLEVYDINNNQITGSAFIGTVGLDWQFAGIAPVHAAGASDLVLRNTNTGAFEVYDIANNQISTAASLGQVGLEWQLGGFASNAPTASTGSMGNSSGAAQLVQAMAGFGGSGGAADGLNSAPLGSDTSQQPLLTMPHHT